MNNLRFENPEFLYLLFLLLPALAWYVWKDRSGYSSIQTSGITVFREVSPGLRPYLRHVMFFLRMLTAALLIIVLARPQSVEKWQESTTEGIDIILTLDISGSMRARDLKPDRLESSKNVAIEFISGRPNDRIGLVVYAGESFTQCPLTTDHAVLINLFKEVKPGMIEDGTAIGVGLTNAVSRLKNSKAESKVIILLTDGVNNRGEVPPLTAAEIASTFGVRVYTIGVGTQGMAPMPVQTPWGEEIRNMPVEIDEEVLQKIADITGGKYFRATNNKKLVEIYKEIDQMEKSLIDVKNFSKKEEEYFGFAMAAGSLFLLELLLRFLVWRKLP